MVSQYIDPFKVQLMYLLFGSHDKKNWETDHVILIYIRVELIKCLTPEAPVLTINQERTQKAHDIGQ